MSSRLPAPTSLSRPGIVVAIVAGAIYVIARSTGAGWDIVILCALVAVLLLGAIWPAVAVLGISATAHTKRDATVGRLQPVTLELAGHARGLRVRVSIDPESRSDWVHADAPRRGEVTVTPARRGICPTVVVEVRSSSPLGLVGWRRRFRVELDRPLEVAPRPASVRYHPNGGTNHEAQGRPRAGATGPEVTRGVREYVDGDPIRLVHWPATARTGSVMVRELEGPQHPRIMIVVDLRGPGPDAEIAASRAAGLALAALARGSLVDLATVETTGPRNGRVESPVDVGRRLARAVSGSPAPGSVPAGVDVRRVSAGVLE